MSLVRVNGVEREHAAASLADLLREVGCDLDRPGIAVAVNDEVVPRPLWGSRRIEPGDRIEIVTAVQGG
jgi:sulfur carrier protein